MTILTSKTSKIEAKTAILVPERRVLHHIEAELRVSKRADGKQVIEGYAAKFDKMSQNLGGFREKIDRKAFEDCISRCDVRCLREHDPREILGRTKPGTMRLSTDDIGLKFSSDVPDTQVGKDTVTDIEDGNLDGCSFSFTTKSPGGDKWEGDWDDDELPVRTILDVKDLFDVGPVQYPAYLDTSVNCRSFDRFIEAQNLVQRERDNQLKRLRILKVRLGHFILERGNCGKAQSDAS